MPEKKKKMQITKRSFTFFGGIAFCLLAVVLILNVGYIIRAVAFPFVFFFGAASYLIYFLIYAYGLSLFFREKGIKFRLNNFLVGGLIIFLGVLVIATLVATSKQALSLSDFSSRFNAILKEPETGKNYWQASFVNLFKQPFGGGIIGYFLTAAFVTGLKVPGSWVIAILIVLGGIFVIFLPYIMKIIKRGQAKEKAPVKEKEREVITSSPSRVTSEDVIASASRLDDVKPEPLPRPSAPLERVDAPTNPAISTPTPSYTPSSNFVPARFSKYLLKTEEPVVSPSVEQPKVVETPVQPQKSEQITLDFDQKPELNEALVRAQPEFIEPVSVPSSRPEPVATPTPVIETPVVERKPIKWVPPSTELLETIETHEAIEINNSVANERMLAINGVFADFHVGATCNSYIVGPAVTRYAIEYANNVSVKSVANLLPDISVRLSGVGARFEPVVEGQPYSGLEVPNAKITTVSFKEVYELLPDVKKKPLAVAFGKSIEGKVITASFDEFPHVLVAGTTGSGKSIFTHSVICTLIMRNSPENLKLVLIDPKKVEMSKYRDIPHLLCPIINDANTAKLTLSKLVDEMNRRYEVLDVNGCSDIKQYNELLEEKPELEKLPYIIVFIDEYADLVDVCKDVSGPVVSIAQKARACGIHMLIATQRPSTNVITGVIKGNLPTRVALAVAMQVDSVTILGEGGAEKLLGKGDMLVQSPLVSRVGMVRLQGCYIQNKEILHVVGYLKEHYPPMYDPNFCNLQDAAAQAASDVIGSPEFQSSQEDSVEAKYQSVKEWVMANEYMSMSRIQRECGVGFNRAGRFFKRLQEEGIVDTENDGNKGCKVLVHDKFYEGSVESDIPTSTDQSDFGED